MDKLILKNNDELELKQGRISSVSAQSIQSLLISGCPNIDGLSVLREIYDEQVNQIKHIYLNWTGDKTGDNDTMEVLDALARNILKDKTTRVYQGINIDGTDNTNRPVVNGSLVMDGGFYVDYLNELDIVETVSVEDSDLIKITVSNFGTLYITYDPSLTWIHFVDPVVKALFTDTELPVVEAIEYTDFGSMFVGNTSITDFPEHSQFTGVHSINFDGCTGLGLTRLGSNITSLPSNAFRNCTSIPYLHIENQNPVTLADNSVFSGTDFIIWVGDGSSHYHDLQVKNQFISSSSYWKNLEDRIMLWFDHVTESLLPEQYTRVNYIQSSGAGGININLPQTVNKVRTDNSWIIETNNMSHLGLTTSTGQGNEVLTEITQVTSSTILLGFVGRLWLIDASKDGAVVSYLLPAYENSTNNVGLYDTVRKRFYYATGYTCPGITRDLITEDGNNVVTIDNNQIVL